MTSLDLFSALYTHFGFSSFRIGQREAIEHVLARRDVLVVMPTGSGKSLCYQLPALLLNGVTLVISPLIALMKDQVDALTAMGKRATYINSMLPAREQKERLMGLARGEYKIVYVAPERLRNADFLRALAKTRVELLAVDEAHCISQWGHDFRPDYQHIREFIPKIGKPSVLALTATATPDVQNDILKQLGLVNAQRIVTGFNRPNLSFAVRYTPSVADKYRDLPTHLRGSCIVYTGTRREAEEVTEFINAVVRLRAAYYHAGLDEAERTRVQDDFMCGRIPVIVATNAFGMGVDKPDIRAVIHFNMPSSIEAYYQEVGRAGRDGKPARGILLYSPEDRALQEWFIENGTPKPEQTLALYRTLPRGIARVASFDLQRETGMNDTILKLALRQLEIAGVVQRLGDERGAMWLRVENVTHVDLSASVAEMARLRAVKQRKLAQMIRYAETNSCRRRFILNYFGDRSTANAPNCCDNHIATTPQPTRRAESKAEWILLVILETVQTLKRPLGRDKIAMILRGSQAQEFIKRGYHRHEHYGKLQHLTLRAIGALIEQLMARGYLKTIGGAYPVITLTPLGEHALRTRMAIRLDARVSTSKEKCVVKTARLKAGGTLERTLELAQQGLTPTQIAKQRGLSLGTIYGHLEQLVAAGKIAPHRFIEPNVYAQIVAAMKQWDGQWLSSLKALLPEEISYDQIRLVVAGQKIKQPETSAEQATVESEKDNRTFQESSLSEDTVQKFLSTPRPKPLRGPWTLGFALDFNSKFTGTRWTRTELGEWVYRFKYGGQSIVVEPLAARLANFLRAHPEMQVNLIVPIPSTQKERLYDPVPLLARTLGKEMGIEVNETVLVKTRATKLQKDMTNLAQKQANVRGAFAVTNAGALRGKRILLIDDFYDSGATLAEATHVVLAAGAAEVHVLTVTKTIHTD